METVFTPSTPLHRTAAHPRCHRHRRRCHSRRPGLAEDAGGGEEEEEGEGEFRARVGSEGVGKVGGAEGDEGVHEGEHEGEGLRHQHSRTSPQQPRHSPHQQQPKFTSQHHPHRQLHRACQPAIFPGHLR